MLWSLLLLSSSNCTHCQSSNKTGVSLYIVGMFLGISGWFPLNICSSGYTTLPTAEKPCNSGCVGGVEISINFTSAEDRTAVLQSGAKLGWSPSAKGIGVNSQTGDTVATWETDLQFEMQIEGALLPAETVAIPTSVKEKYKLCYLRYKFYDRGKYL